MPKTTYDLTNLQLAVGNHTIRVKIGANGYQDSAYSNSITATVYSISYNISNASVVGATTTLEGQEVIFTFTANSGYALPSAEDISITNATMFDYIQDGNQGTITLTNISGNVVVNASCVINQYSIMTSVTNGTKTGDTTIIVGSTAQVTLSPSYSYELPSTITVNGATGTSGSVGVDWTYNSTSGVVSLSNPTSNILIEAICTKIKLATPTNVSMVGTTVSCDGVQYAETYEYYIDDVLLGEYTP